MSFFPIFLFIAGSSKSFVASYLLSPTKDSESYKQLPLSFYRERRVNKQCIGVSSNGSYNRFVPFGSDAVYGRGLGSRKDEILLFETPDEYPRVVKNSSGIVIGGSCSGGGVVLCLIIYLLYKLLGSNHDQSDAPRPKRVQVAPALTLTPTPPSCWEDV